MTKAEFDSIIQSPEAATFLDMVTEGFYNNSYTALWMFEVMGREWDEMKTWAEGLRYEINPQTCTWSIAIWEWIYGIETDETLPLETRRQRILAKAAGKKSANPETIRRSVAAFLGVAASEVEVNDFVKPYSFEVVIHLDGTEPFSFADIHASVREIKPSHLTLYLTNSHENDPMEVTQHITPWLAQPMGITTLPTLEPELPGITLQITPVQGKGLEITTLPTLEPEFQAAAVFVNPSAAAIGVMETTLPNLEESDTTVMPELVECFTADAQNIAETRLPYLEDWSDEEELAYGLQIRATQRLPLTETRLPYMEDFNTEITAYGTAQTGITVQSITETTLPEMEDL